MLFFTFVILLAWVAACHAQLTSFYSPTELALRQTAAKKYLLEPDNLQTAYYQARILEITKAKHIDCSCPALESLVRDREASPLSVYYGLKAAQLCGCTVKPLRSVEDAIEDDLASDNINKFGGAALAAKIMGLSDAPATDDIVAKVKALMQPSGLFRAQRQETGSSNVHNTKLALRVLSEYVAGDKAMNEVAIVVQKQLTDTENEKSSDPSLLTSIYTLTGKKPTLEGDGSPAGRLQAIGQALLGLRHTTDISQAADVIASLVILMSYKSQPVYVGLEDNNFKYGAKSPKTQVLVKDAFGKTFTDASIEVLAMKKEGKEKSVLQGTVEGGLLDLNKDKSLDVTPGRYATELSVTLSGRPKAIFSTVFFSVFAELSISEVSAGISTDKAVSSIELREMLGQNSWTEDRADAAKNQYVHITFTASTPKKMGPRFQKPHQAFAMFTHEATGTTSYFVAASEGTYMGSGAGAKYRVAVQTNKEAKTMMHLSGSYVVSLLVADALYSSQEYVVGSVHIEFAPHKVEEPALYINSLLHDSDHTLKALPEIQHRMRAPPQSAPILLSLIFTVLAAAPLFLLLNYFMGLNLNLARLASYNAAAFVVGFGLMCIMYALYWLTVPGFLFYDTIFYLLFAFPIMGILGRQGIIAVISAREAEVIAEAAKTVGSLKKSH